MFISVFIYILVFVTLLTDSFIKLCAFNPIVNHNPYAEDTMIRLISYHSIFSHDLDVMYEYRDSRKVYEKDLPLSDYDYRGYNYLLVMAITTDMPIINQIVKNCILHMSLYQKLYSFKGFVFSSSKSVEDYALQHNITVINRIRRNEYGLPYFRSLIISMKIRAKSLYYGYLNSDCLLNPRVFEVLPLIQFKINNGIIPNKAELVSRVKLMNVTIDDRNVSSIKDILNIFYKSKKDQLRGQWSSDIFIFHHSFPFVLIPPIVIGRRKVDNILLKLPSEVNGTTIDITPYAYGLHQGIDGWKIHGYTNQLVTDRDYNLIFDNSTAWSVYDVMFQLRGNKKLWIKHNRWSVCFDKILIIFIFIILVRY